MDALYIILIVTAAVVGLALFLNKRHVAETRTLRQDYETALKSGNKNAALQAGRTYYASLRGGKLSVYDEQAIANDLAAMK